jgi:enterochelin esterase-like enzyme
VLNITARPSIAPFGRTPTPTATPTATAGVPISVLPVTIETLVVNSEFLGETRIASIYLPPQYTLQPDRHFKVLYASDGQEFPFIPFDKMLAELIATRQMEPIIVVAVQSAEGELRNQEYGAGPNINMLGWGTRSEDYNRFLNEELRPQVNQRYRTLTGAENTAIMGWSLGGLVAIYNAWDHPDQYGTVGMFSPSLWWRLPSEPGQELQARVIQNRVRDDPHITKMHLWFTVGTRETPQDVDNNGVNDMIQDINDLMDLLATRGYQEGEDMVYILVQDGHHELATWATVLPDFLLWTFPVN